MMPKEAELEKLLGELHMVVGTTLGLDHPPAVQLREAQASKDVPTMERARDAWLELDHRSKQRIMARAAALHADRIRFAFLKTRAAATALLEAVEHPAFKQLLSASSAACALEASSASPIRLAEANRRFSEALTAWDTALSEGEVDLNLQFRRVPADDAPPTTH
jgi:hypothetical protein